MGRLMLWVTGKSPRRVMLGLLVMFCMLAAPVHGRDMPDVLVVAADEWCPYNCDQGSDRPGYLIEVLKEVFEPLGVAVEYRVMPWRRALIETERGQIHAAVGAVSGNHGNNIIGREGLGYDETILVVNKGMEFSYAGPESLDGRTIGIIVDYTYDGGGSLDIYLAHRVMGSEAIHVIHQDRPLQSLYNMLRHGRIDVFPENRYVAAYTGRGLGLLDEVSFIPTGAGDQVFVAFSPTPQGEINKDILDAGIRRLRDSGRLRTILERYGITESVPSR